MNSWKEGWQMIKKATTKELLKKLNNLQVMVNKRTDQPILISLKEWMESSYSGTFGSYINIKLKNIESDVTLIIDDMLLETNMYLDTTILFYENKESFKKLLEYASNGNDIAFMEKYIEVFQGFFEQDMGYDDLCKKADSCRINLINKNPFLKDFFNHYRVLSIEELVERYKDQRFSKMCNTQVDYKKAL